LARDLHDSAKQLAFAAAAQMNAARLSLKQNPQTAQTHIEQAEHLTKQLRQELTNLIWQLRPPTLSEKSLPSAVREFAGDYSQQNDIVVEVRIEQERPLPLEIEQTIFRIIQEALANVARHSEASRVEIRLVYTKREITCIIIDNGVGFDPDNVHTGYGLRSMEERATAMGANLTVTSVLGKGTSVALAVPLSESIRTNQEKPNG
jgi:NarL family two-component system sensor histidine kinase LiaS